MRLQAAAKHWRFLVLAAVCAALVNPPEASSCGPFIPEAQFALLHGPAGPPEDFLRGGIGVVSGHFYRRWLVISYRNLAGAPLTSEEIAALNPAPETSTSDPEAAVTRWLDARNAVPGIDRLATLDVYKRAAAPGSYDSYRNCLEGAFDTAVETLKSRSAAWGPQSAPLKDWIAAQDQVFSNCSGGPAIPAALAAGADPLQSADRQYQIATAKFYTPQLPQAAADFALIARNAASPWRDTAQYLLIRTSIRDAQLNANSQAWRDAEARLKAILADPAQQKWRKSAQQLLDYVRARAYPEQRLAELGAGLMKPAGARTASDLADYTYMWDTQKNAPAANDDLTDWIETFQAGAAPHAIERWKKQPSAPWLIASLAAVAPTDPAVPELIAAARQMKPNSPAYASAAYYGIKLALAHGDADASRHWLDEALAAALPVSAHNMLLSERLSIARDWPEFLKYSLRQPVAESVDEVDQPTEHTQPTFDTDAAFALNRRAPLALWLEAANSSALPADVQMQVATAGWVRAVLLSKDAEARQFAARVIQLKPAMSAELAAYLAEKDPGAAHFAALFYLLHTPGLQPAVRTGFGRFTSPEDKLDELRDNWWSLSQPDGSKAGSQLEPSAYLTDVQLSQGKAEWDLLLKTAATGANYLCAETVQWVRAHPADPRGAEALHLAVRSTRYTNTDARTGTFSKSAYDLLHAQYPKTKWAQQTPYWFK